MDKTHPYIQTENLNQIIDSFIDNDKFQTNLENLIINALSNKKIIPLSRGKIAEKIVSSDYIRLFEQDLLENILQSMDIDNVDRTELIIKSKTFPAKKAKENLDINSNLDSIQIFNYLVEEFLTCSDLIKLENYLGDLSNFESSVIIRNEKIEQILTKISEFLTAKQKENYEEIYLIPNLINFMNKLLKNSPSKVLLDAFSLFLSYFQYLVDKFFKGSFDITKFYKISLNLECLNNLILKFYSEEIIVRKMDEMKVKDSVAKLIQVLVKNYQPENPVYIESSNNAQNQEFGISTNYMLLLLFNLDKDFCSLKILFRDAQMRKYIIQSFESLENLPFIDIINTYESFKTKNCFVWKHPQILEQIFPKNKITKKHLIFSWISIKLHFLGLTVRHKSLKNLFYKTFKEEDFNCSVHFMFLVDFVIELLFKNIDSSGKEFFGDDFEFEANQQESLFFLIKEILCDFLLYCDKQDCLFKKQSHIISLYNNLEYKENKMFVYLLDDLFLALRENYLYFFIRNKETEDSLKNEEEEELNKFNANISQINENSNEMLNVPNNDRSLTFDNEGDKEK